MGIIKIKGHASRKVNADKVRYRITFISKDVKASRASEQVKTQCDIFLKAMKELGFDVSGFHLDSDVIENSYNKDEKEANRIISFEIKFDPKINNTIYSIVKKEDLNTDIETDFFLSNRKKLCNELLQEALLDSKRKAELIAEANDQKVKYAETICDSSDDLRYNKDYESKERIPMDILGLELNDKSLSAELSAKQIEEYVDLYVTWVIE